MSRRGLIFQLVSIKVHEASVDVKRPVLLDVGPRNTNILRKPLSTVDPRIPLVHLDLGRFKASEYESSARVKRRVVLVRSLQDGGECSAVALTQWIQASH